jgi:hypothetical protein
MGSTCHKAMVECPCGWPVLAIIGLVKGIISVVPCTVALFLGTVITTLVNIPHNLYNAYSAIIKTPKLATKIKVIVGILLPIALLIAAPLAVVITLLGAVCYSLFGPAVYTFTEDYIFISGWVHTWSDCFYHVPKKSWEFWWDEAPKGAKEFEDYKLKEDEEPFDVPIWWVFIGLLYALVGGLLDAIGGLILGVVHCIPATVKVLYKVLKYYFESWKEPCLGVTFTIFVVPVLAIALVGTPIVSIIGATVVGAFYGGSSAGAAYKNGYGAGFKRISHAIYSISDFFSKAIYGNDNKSWLGCFKMEEE